MLRIFTAISLPAALRQQLQLLQGGISGARWVHPADYHVTLTFIGDVDEAAAEEIDDLLSTLRAPAFTLTLKGAGSFFRGAEPGHLWIGVEQSDALHHLKEKIDRALSSRRIPFENRKYTPHVTLARLKHVDDTKVGEFIQQHNLFTGGPFEVEEFILYRSHRGHAPPLYEELAGYPLVLF